MKTRPKSSDSASISSGDTHPVLLRHHSDSLPSTPPKLLHVKFCSHNSENDLLAGRQKMSNIRRTPEPRSFYAHVVHTQTRRRLSESPTMAKVKSKDKPARAATRVSTIVLALVLCGINIGLIAWAVLLSRPNHTCEEHDPFAFSLLGAIRGVCCVAVS